MPELPEVENVKLSLQQMGTVGQCFTKVELKRQGLRVPFPRKISQHLQGQKVLAVHRRAKYLLFETEKYFLLSHLGMTGHWRASVPDDGQKHDHVVLHFASGLKLIFNDARRFGVLDLFDKQAASKNRWLKHLGVEPLSDDFTGALLTTQTRGLKCSIKAFLMDQRRVVGVGNIYASEALFKAGVLPTRRAGRIKADEAERIVTEVRDVLQAAIEAGGSTIRDYRNSHGEDGRFQDRFVVYGRKGEPCVVCSSPIKARVIAGRNTFMCTQCQR